MATDPFANPHNAPYAQQGQQPVSSPFGMGRQLQQQASPQQNFGSAGSYAPQGQIGNPQGMHQRHPQAATQQSGLFAPNPGYQQASQVPPYQQPQQPLQPLQPLQQQAPMQQQQQQQQHPAAQAGSQQGHMWSQFAPADPVLRGAAMLGINHAQEAMQSSIARYMPGMALFWGVLKYHFNVNNKYVVSKVRLLLFPFRQVSWARERSHTTTGGSSDAPRYAPPVADINAPDLYIPVMAFVTYVLLIGLVKGTRMKFTPEVITASVFLQPQDTFNATLLTLFIEVLVMKLCTYILPGDATVSIALTDLAIYCSYIYVGLVLDLLTGLLFAGPNSIPRYAASI